MTRLDDIIKGIKMNANEPLHHRLTSINIINIRLYDTKTDTTMTMQTVSPTLTPTDHIINGFDDYFILYLYYILYTRTRLGSIAILTHDTRMISDLQTYLRSPSVIPPIHITMKQNDKVLFTSQLVYNKEEIESSDINIYHFLM
jgi:hypothetical protein